MESKAHALNPKSVLKNSQGFFIMEIMIASSLALVVILAVLALQLASEKVRLISAAKLKLVDDVRYIENGLSKEAISQTASGLSLSLTANGVYGTTSTFTIKNQDGAATFPLATAANLSLPMVHIASIGVDLNLNGETPVAQNEEYWNQFFHNLGDLYIETAHAIPATMFQGTRTQVYVSMFAVPVPVEVSCTIDSDCSGLERCISASCQVPAPVYAPVADGMYFKEAYLVGTLAVPQADPSLAPHVKSFSAQFGAVIAIQGGNAVIRDAFDSATYNQSLSTCSGMGGKLEFKSESSAAYNLVCNVDSPAVENLCNTMILAGELRQYCPTENSTLNQIGNTARLSDTAMVHQASECIDTNSRTVTAQDEDGNITTIVTSPTCAERLTSGTTFVQGRMTYTVY